MSVDYLVQNYHNGGVSLAEKEGIRGAVAFTKAIDFYQDPNRATILPKSVKVSSTTVTNLPKWMVSGSPNDTNHYVYDLDGKIYEVDSSDTFTELRDVASSVGQGMELHDDYIYYTQNTQIGRYGPLSSSPSFTDNWQTGLTNTSTTGFAPIKRYQNGFLVGHGNKVGWWDGSTWTAAQLTLPAGLHVRSIDVVDEFAVIGTWRGTTITANEEGYLFFWDGVSSTFNFFFSNPEGGCNGMVNSRNRLISIWGSSGTMYMGYNPFSKIHQLPKLTTKKYAEVLPGAISTWKGLTAVGFTGNTDQTDVEQGVYLWGSKSDAYPEALNFAFPISTGTTTGTTLKIGMVKGIGNALYIGWRDASTYGVDKVTISNDPYTQGVIESLIFDNGIAGKEKEAEIIKATHLALASGETVQLGYKKNRATNYTTGDANSTVGSTETRLVVPMGSRRFNEFQYEVILGTSGSTAPTVTSHGLKFNNLKEDEEGF